MEENQTLTEDAAPSTAQNSDELIDTMDEPIVPSLEAAQKTDEVVEKEVAAEPIVEKEPEEDRFDKHPRFQELIKFKKESSEELKALKAQLAERAEPKEPEFKDVMGMTEDEIQEWMDTDPKAYQANLIKQIRADVANELRSEQNQSTEEQRVLKTFDSYAAENKTFDPMWDSGEIQAFMNANPGHNAISAHMAMTMADKETEVEARIKEAVEKAQKETEEKVIKQFKAKKGAQVLGSGPASTGTVHDVAPELKDPKKYGGINTVLAARLAERRRAG